MKPLKTSYHKHPCPGLTQYFAFLFSVFLTKRILLSLDRKLALIFFKLVLLLIKRFSLVCYKIAKFAYRLFEKSTILLISFSSTSILFFFTHQKCSYFCSHVLKNYFYLKNSYRHRNYDEKCFHYKM